MDDVMNKIVIPSGRSYPAKIIFSVVNLNIFDDVFMKFHLIKEHIAKSWSHSYNPFFVFFKNHFTPSWEMFDLNSYTNVFSICHLLTFQLIVLVCDIFAFEF